MTDIIYWLNQNDQPTIVDTTNPNWKSIYKTLSGLSFEDWKPSVEIATEPTIEAATDAELEEIIATDEVVQEVTPKRTRK